MNGLEDGIPVQRIVAPPAMPTADMQELLVRRVTEQSAARMRKWIGSLLTFAATVAGVLGWQGYMRIQALDAQRERAESRAHDLEERIHGLDAEVRAAKELQQQVLASSAIQQNAYQGLITRYQQSADAATRQAVEAATAANGATASIRSSAQSVEQRLAFVNDLGERVASAERRVGDANQHVEQIAQRLDNTIFSTWSAVVDEGRGFVPIGDRGFEVAAVKIHNGNTAQIALRDEQQQPVCGESVELTIGRSRECGHGAERYRITLVLAMKQGGIGFGYRDRAQVQLARVATGGAGDGRQTIRAALTP